MDATDAGSAVCLPCEKCAHALFLTCFLRVEYCLRFTCGEREGLQGCGWGYRTNKQWLPHHSGLDATLTSNPLSSKVWQVSSFWKVHYFCRIHSEQQMICENKAIVFTFYSPPHPKLLGFPMQLFEKFLKEEFSFPSRVIHCHAKNNTETFQPVWLFLKVIHAGAQGFVIGRHNITFASLSGYILSWKCLQGSIYWHTAVCPPKWRSVLISGEICGSKKIFQRSTTGVQK